ncbi:MAG TPA: DUF1638 domain-containing protein [Thermodesulfobacteriota bacterium]|nr:DUF1638 domain-containing protein [Thermodesulfobacteriota bacterium]
MNLIVIACSIMKEELTHVSHDGVSFVFLEQSLHRTPQKMKDAIQAEIDKAGDRPVVLGYGLCSNGLLGIRAGKNRVAVPKAHDCITFFLGSRARYMEEHNREPGTYYLTRGWIDERKSPLGILDEYCRKYGKETAEWAIREELKNYTRIALVESELGVSESHRSHAEENARFLNLRYEELRGSLDFFRKIVESRWDDDFIILNPGEELTQDKFFE